MTDIGNPGGGSGDLSSGDNISELTNDSGYITEVPAADEVSYKSGRKNLIINGNFAIWQRATSQTSSGYGSADRWNSGHSGSTTKTTSRQAFTLGQTDVPFEPAYYSRTAVTTGSTAASFAALVHKVEGVRSLAGQTATLSFYAKADSAKDMAIEIQQNFGSGGSPSSIVSVAIQTVSLTSSWQKYSYTFAIDSITGKTLGSNLNDNLTFNIWLDAGSDFDARTNSLGNQSGTFDIAQVQLEAGDVATDFELRPVTEELILCQRYYETSGSGGPAWSGGTNTAQSYISDVSYKVTKRASPTVTATHADAAGFSSADPTPTGDQEGFVALKASNGTPTDGAYFLYTWTADAEL